MSTCLRLPAAWRLARLQLPALTLIALLQRTPVLRWLAAPAPAWVAAPFGQSVRTAALAATALGAVDTLAGATTFSANPPSPAAAAVGTPFSAVFAVTGAPAATKSYTISGLPPGLTVTGATTVGTALRLNAGTGTITGTPTSGGSFAVSITAWENTNAGGRNAVYAYTISVAGEVTIARPAITTPPASQRVTLGGIARLSVTATGTGTLAYQWRHNGVDLEGATSPSLTVANVVPAKAGVYTVAVTNAAGTTESAGAIVGPAITTKVSGTGSEVGTDIQHPNGNTYDQILLSGAAASITADPGQVVRTSYLDLSDDIVQVEFSGAGTLSITLAGATGPAEPALYNQAVPYMKGHATLTIVGADGTTNVSAFTVGTGTAVNQALFQANADYDGVADLAAVNIASTDGRFGGLRFANTEFWASGGYAGIYAPGVDVAAVVNVHNVAASDQATPALLTGAIGAGRIGITGGNMLQPNGRAILVGVAPSVVMLAGETSHRVPQPAQQNQGSYTRDGIDVTASLVVNPAGP